MLHLPNIIHGLAVLGGGIALAGISFSRRESIEEMVNRIDVDLQQRLHALVEKHADEKAWTYKTNLDFWRAIGGLPGIPHLFEQARLRLRLMVQIRRERPEDFAFEQGMLKGATRSLFLGMLGSLGETLAALVFPRIRCIAAKVTATVFCHLAAEIESVLAEYQYGTS